MYQIDKPDNVVEILEQSVAKFPKRPFLGTKNKQKQYDWTTYEDFGKRVDNVRSGLQQLGIQKDDAVGIISNNSEDWAVCFFASSGLAARFVPMYEAELVQTWKYIIADANVKVLFIAKKEIYDKIKDFTTSLPALKKVIIIEGEGPDTLAELEKKGAAMKVKSVRPDHTTICILIYTSGTTGDPKGVLLCQHNITSNANATVAAYPNVNENDCSLSILPWAHVYGLGELITFCRLGASVGLAEKASTVVEDIMLVKPTFLTAVPTIFNRVYDGLWTKMNEEGGLPKKLFVMGVESAKKKRELAAEGKSCFMTNLKFKIADAMVFSKVREKLGGRLKGSMTGSAAMNVDISHFFWDIGIPLYDAYGLTETSPGVSLNGPTKYKLGSVGPIMKNYKVVIDKSMVDPDAKDGEVVVYGPNVMQGYHNKPEATKAVMTPDGGFRTGDRGRLDEDGFLFITGRLKEQYKLENGKYVFPAAIEEDIRLNHYIENAMIYGEGRAYNVCIVIPDFVALGKWAEKNNLPKEPAQLVQRDEMKSFLTNEILNSIKGKYGGYEIPKKFIFLGEPFSLQNGTLTQTMKLKRRVVSERLKNQIDALYAEK
ncbi:MAG: long-chain fatty acid--CoA ligase [Deltaproteobacteria bacterium HGW-Deltaproteobacteria-13]|jgi:long-chain acyl-CoA synthetase|nr:MAG: long-chain fatty acid--CoA ligase [Deltaproteobacteria bacterium HGW-Deltaproteobacteria-13]